MLILALVYLVVCSVVVLALASWATNNLNNTTKIGAVRTLQIAAASATQFAINSIRHQPIASTVSTGSTTPQSYCWGTGLTSSMSIDGDQMTVWCNTMLNPSSQATRIVTLSTCLSSVTSGVTCAASPELRAVVTFDDYPPYPPKGMAPMTQVCVATCGAGLTINDWLFNPTSPTVLSIGPVSAGSSTVTASPTSVPVGGTTATVSVSLYDGDGYPIPNKTISLAAVAGNSTITSAQAVTSSSGVATFLVDDNVAQSVTYSATDMTDNTAITHTGIVTFTAGAVSASTSTATANPTSLCANGNYTSTVTVTLLDAYNNPVSGKSVGLTAKNGSSTITTNGVTTSSSGQATFSVSDTSGEMVVYTATDSTDNVQLTHTVSVTFNSGYRNGC